MDNINKNEAEHDNMQGVELNSQSLDQEQILEMQFKAK